jgi:hypothetical protein
MMTGRDGSRAMSNDFYDLAGKGLVRNDTYVIYHTTDRAIAQELDQHIRWPEGESTLFGRM